MAYILTNTTKAFYGIGEKFSIGSDVYTVKDKKFVKGNLLNNGGFKTSTVNWDSYYENVSGDGNVELYLYDYQFHHQCVRLTSDTSVSNKTVAIESRLYTNVLDDQIYNLDFYQKSNIAHTTSVKFLYYQNDSGTQCTTSSAVANITYSTTWMQKTVNIFGNQTPTYRQSARYDFRWMHRLPSDCNYIKLRFYSVYDDIYRSDLLLDGIKLWEATTDAYRIFTETTSDAMLIIPQESLVDTIDDQTIIYMPFVQSTAAVVGTVNLKATTDVYFQYRNKPDFDLMTGGICFPNQYTNVINNNIFQTTDGWNAVNCAFDISSSISYDPLFGTYCTKIYNQVREHTSYIYATATINNSSAYWISFYAKSHRSQGGYVYCEASSDSVTSSTFAMVDYWQRFQVYHPAGGTNLSLKIGNIRTHTYDFYVDGVIAEPFSTGFPSVFDQQNSAAGTNKNGFIKFHCTEFKKDIGSVSIHYVPEYNSDQFNSSACIFVAYDSSGAVTDSDNKMEIIFDGSDDTFKVKTYNAGNIREISSYATTFAAGNRINLIYTWRDNSTGYLYVNTAQYSGSVYLNTVDAFQLGGLYVDPSDFRQHAYGSYTNFIVSSAFTTSGEAIQIGNDRPTPSKYMFDTAYLHFTKWDHIGTREREEDSDDPLTWNHVDVIPNRYYEYKIRCYDRDGNLSEFSATAGIAAGDYYAPDVVSATSSIGDYGGITFKWHNPSDEDLKAINIYDDDGLTLKRHVVYTDSSMSTEYYFSTPDEGYGKFIYLTSIDYNGNESDPVTVYGETLSISSITYGYSSPNPNDRREGKYFKYPHYKIGSTEYNDNFSYSFYVTFDETVTALTHDLKRPNGSAIYPASRTNTDVTDGDLCMWLCKGTIEYDDSITSGIGAIQLGYTKGGQSIINHIPIQFDADFPPIDNTTGISIEDDSGSQLNNSIRVICPFTAAYDGNFDLTSKLDYIWIDAVHDDDYATYTFFTGDQGFRVPFLENYSGTDVKCPIVLTDKIGTYHIKARAYDVAQNYWEYGSEITYDYVGSDIRLSWWSSLTDDINENGWLNNDLINFSTDYLKCTASVSSGDEITKLTVNHTYTNPSGTLNNIQAYAIDPWDGTEHIVNAWATYLMYYEGHHYVDLTAYSKLGKLKTARIDMFKVDQTKPVITSGDILDEDNSHLKNRQVTIVINQSNISDAYSGYWKTLLYRKVDDGAYPSDPIVVLDGDHTVFTDSDERLEGYRLYTYKGIAYDKAGNTAGGTDDLSFLMTPDWEFTYRNKINNGSFELYEDKFTDGAIESWDNSRNYYDGTVNERRIATDTSCFGGASFFMNDGNDYIICNMFVEETTMRPEGGYLISWYGNSDAGKTVNIRYYDYANQSLGYRTITAGTDWSGGGAGNSYVGADGNTWYRRWYLLDPTTWNSDTAQCTLLDVRIWGDGPDYLDGVMVEAATATQTTPTRFRDNRVLTADRFEAGYIYGNMIKAAQIHGGHIHAGGISVVDSELGAPSITVGEYADNKSFVRMGHRTLYYHDSATGSAKEQGMFFTRHIEADKKSEAANYGENRFGQWYDFVNRYTNWAGCPINPHMVITPMRYWAMSSTYGYNGATNQYQYHHFTTRATASQYCAYHYIVSTPGADTWVITPSITCTYNDLAPTYRDMTSNRSRLPVLKIGIQVTFSCAGEGQYQHTGGYAEVYRTGTWHNVGYWDVSVTEYSGSVTRVFDFVSDYCYAGDYVRIVYNRRTAGGGASNIASVVFSYLRYFTPDSYEEDKGEGTNYEFIAMDGGLYEGF